MYLLDSNVLVDFLRGKNAKFLEMLRKSNAQFIKIPAIVKGELLLGAEKSTDVLDAKLCVENLLSPYEVLPFDEECSAHYARIRAFLERKGMPIGPNDTMIAACALRHGATLVTNSVAEFRRVPGLAVESWEEIDF